MTHNLSHLMINYSPRSMHIFHESLIIKPTTNSNFSMVQMKQIFQSFSTRLLIGTTTNSNSNFSLAHASLVVRTTVRAVTQMQKWPKRRWLVTALTFSFSRSLYVCAIRVTFVSFKKHLVVVLS
jgi:hypothetical protein